MPKVCNYCWRCRWWNQKLRPHAGRKHFHLYYLIVWTLDECLNTCLFKLRGIYGRQVMPIAIIFHSSWINLTINFATVFWLFPKNLQCFSYVNPHDFFCLSNQWHVPHLRIPEPPQANRMPIAFGKPWFQGPMGWPLKIVSQNERNRPSPWFLSRRTGQTCHSKLILEDFETAERKWVEGLMEERIEFGSKKT